MKIRWFSKATHIEENKDSQDKLLKRIRVFMWVIHITLCVWVTSVLLQPSVSYASGNPPYKALVSVNLSDNSFRAISLDSASVIAKEKSLEKFHPENTTFVDIYDQNFLEQSKQKQEQTGKHWLDEYKNVDSNAEKWAVEAGKIMLVVDEEARDEGCDDLIEDLGGNIVQSPAKGRRYLYFPHSTDLFAVRDALRQQQAIQHVGFSLLGKGTCAIDYDGHNNAALTNDAAQYYMDTVRALCETYNLDKVRLFILDDGLSRNAQGTGHPGFDGQISTDSRNIYYQLVAPSADSTTIDQNTSHWNLAWRLIDNSQGPFVPYGEDDKYVVYKTWSNWGISPYVNGLALDQIVARKQAHPDVVCIVSDARFSMEDPTTPTAVKQAYDNARANGVIVINGIGNDAEHLTPAEGIPYGWQPECSVMSRLQLDANTNQSVAAIYSNYSEETILAFCSAGYYPNPSQDPNGYTIGVGTSMTSSPIAIVMALSSYFHNAKTWEENIEVFEAHSRKGIHNYQGTWYSPNVMNPKVLDIVKSWIFPEIVPMSQDNGKVEVNYKKAHNHEGLVAYLDPSTPWYVLENGKEYIDPSILSAGNHTATVIVQIPGKTANGGTCIIDYPITRDFEVLQWAVTPSIDPIPQHFDSENAIQTTVSNVPANASSVSATLDGTALAVNRNQGTATASANMGNTSVGSHTIAWTYVTPEGTKSSEQTFQVLPNFTINTQLNPETVTEPSAVSAELTDDGYNWVSPAVKVGNGSWQTVSWSTANVIYTVMWGEVPVQTKYVNTETGNTVATDTDNLHVIPRTPTIATIPPGMVGHSITVQLNNHTSWLHPQGTAECSGVNYPLNFSGNTATFTPTTAGSYTITVYNEAGGVSGAEATQAVEVLPEGPIFSLNPRNTVYEGTDISGQIADVPTGATASVSYNGQALDLAADNSFVIENPSSPWGEVKVEITEGGQTASTTQQLIVLNKINPNMVLSADTVYFWDGVYVSVSNTEDFASFVDYFYDQNGGGNTQELPLGGTTIHGADVGNHSVEVTASDPAVAGSNIGADQGEYVVRPTVPSVSLPDTVLLHTNQPAVIEGEVSLEDGYSYDVTYKCPDDNTWNPLSLDVNGRFSISASTSGEYSVKVIKTRNGVSTPKTDKVIVEHYDAVADYDRPFDNLQTYPNPVDRNGVLHFNGLPWGTTKITLLDITWKQLLVEFVEGTSADLSLSDNLQAGTYILLIENSGYVTRHKLVIK